jgi:hypothetical protein
LPKQTHVLGKRNIVHPFLHISVYAKQDGEGVKGEEGERERTKR